MTSQSVIDGDLCEQYNSLDPAKKRSIADDLDRTPSEVGLSVFQYEVVRGSKCNIAFRCPRS